MTELRVTDITMMAKTVTLVEKASFSLKTGELVIVLGPNGAGKTSLIRGALNLERAASGATLLDEQPLETLTPSQRARQIAYLPQIRPLAWPNRVRDIVALGRFSHGAALGRLNATDEAAVSRAIAACDLIKLEHRNADTLSGGELARVHCARAFAADCPLLFADEPTAALDPRHQFRILDLIQSYVDAGGGALLVLHDIELAARYASRLIWMKDGKILADGSVGDTLTAARLAEVYGVRANVDGQRVIMDGTL